jgi:outer membrane protein assembly factor BamB
VNALLAGDGAVYASLSDKLIALSAGDGSLLWQRGGAFLGAAVQNAGDIFSAVSCGDGLIVVFLSTYHTICLSAVNASDGSVHFLSPPIADGVCLLFVICGGSAYSGPALGADTAYAVSSTYTYPDSQTTLQEQFVQAFETSSSALRWKYAVPGTQGLSRTTATVALLGADARAVYYASSDGSLTALDPSQQQPRWTTMIPTSAGTTLQSQGSAGHVIEESVVYAISLDTGSTLWTASLT